VYSWQQYAAEWQTLLHRHFHVFGRYNQTLAESSFDTWLDGYKAGIPDRKVNMYVKGALVAFVLDMHIRRDTSGQLSLDDVMRDLYFRFAKQGKGYSEEDYISIISQLAGRDYTSFFERFIWGLEPIEQALEEAWDMLGCNLVLKDSNQIGEGRFGMRIKEESKNCIVGQIVPASPAEKAGLSLGDEIIAINGMQVDKNSLEDHLAYWAEKPKRLTVMRSRRLAGIDIMEGPERYFPQYSIQKNSNAGGEQKENFRKWAKLPF
jgi:predicted metalloprotease with PDZ domain